MIVVNQLTYEKEKRKILNNITFSIPEKTIIAIVGENGAGKTTLIEVITGIRHHIKDAIKIPKNKRIVYIHEDLLVFEYLTVREFIQMVAELNRLTSNVRKDIMSSFEHFQINNLFSTKIQDLSLGERQKILLLIGFLSQPDYLFFDEPFNGLDLLSYQMYIELLKQYKQKCSIFFSTHELKNLNEVCDCVLFLRAGKIEKKLYKEAGDLNNVHEIYKLFQNKH